MYKGLTLKPEAKLAWIEALGTHEQGRSGLVCQDTYCCLGVFAKINGAEVVDGEAFKFSKSGPEADSYLPARWFSRFLNFHKNKNVELTKLEAIEFLQAVLATKNDGGDPFSQIAQWVKDNL